MISSSPYPSPADTRAKRQGGRGFYKDRNRPYPKQRHEERDERRAPEAREAAALARSLAELARQFPHYKELLNQTSHRVLVRARSDEWKRGAIKKCLSAEPLTVDEIVSETGLDRTDAIATLSVMVQLREAETCTRTGGRIKIRSHGRPTEKVFWRRGDQ